MQRLRRGRSLRLLAFAGAACAAPVEAQIRQPWQAPTLTTIRYDEDWTALADPAKRTDWTSRLKYIPLGDGDRNYLTTGLEWRERVESYLHDEWDTGPTANQTYLWSRLLPYADLHVGAVRAFVQPMLSYAAGVYPGPSPVDQSRLDMLQAFADVDIISHDDKLLIVRGGREMLSLGTERLIGTRYGPNVPLAFDGARAIWKSRSTRITALLVRPVEPGPASFDDRSSPTRKLWGVYATRLLPDPAIGFDLYYLGFHNEQARFANAAGLEHRQTVGAGFFGSTAPLHWNVEGVYQFGDIADRPIRAWSVATEVGRKFGSIRFRPDFTVRADIASGDGGGRHFGTINALFPKGKYFGELTPIGPYNIINVNPALGLELARTVAFGLSGQAFWRHRREDGIYGVPGNLLRAAGSSQARFIGSQIEATLQWQATRQMAISSSISAFYPGGFIAQTGSSNVIRMFGAEANFRF